ncbi:MAG: B12-binding domain-containing protein [Planctomycetota bacterium]|nr:B12-binding domain-containing protein [Planctomycetota bacterium]
MATSKLLNQYMEPLIGGRRRECRALVQDAISKGSTARSLYQDLIWPAMDRVEQMYRDDRINQATEHLATRINRVVADHLQTSLRQNEVLGKRVLITCAHGEPEELGAQMCSDLFEAEGWDVYLLGGGVPDDEVLMLVGQLQPELLLIIGSQPIDAPAVRQMIDQIREIGSCPTMNVMVSGGVFNRAADLWKEVKADLFAATAVEALVLASSATPRKPEIRMEGAPKKRRRRRRPPLLVQAEGQA